MRILEQDQQRPLRHAGELLEQGLERQRLLALGRDLERRVALAGRDRQQRRQQRRRAGDLTATLAEQRLELVELDLRRIGLLQVGRALQLVEHRMQRAVDVERRAVVAQHGGVLAEHVLAERLHDARLADPGLAGQQDHVAVARPGALPARQQQPDLLVAADQRRQAAPGGGLEPTRRAGRLAHLVDRDRRLDSLDHVRTALLEDDQALDQPPGPLADHDGAGLGQLLQAGGDVRGLADHRHLVAELAGADVADHHEPGVDADPDVDADPEALELAIEAPDRLDDVEPGADRPQRVVLMRLGIAEIGQHGVAGVVADVALEARDDLGAALLVAPQHLVQILRIEPGRERGRADHVAEHHGQLAALGAVGAAQRAPPPARARLAAARRQDRSP